MKKQKHNRRGPQGITVIVMCFLLAALVLGGSVAYFTTGDNVVSRCIQAAVSGDLQQVTKIITSSDEEANEVAGAGVQTAQADAAAQNKGDASQTDANAQAEGDAQAAGDAAQTGAAAQTETSAQAETTAVNISDPATDEISASIEQADLLAATYDYDGAIEMLKALPQSASDQRIIDAIAGYEATKATCVAADVYSVPHIFYHSLVNDPSVSFDAGKLGQSAADGFNAWMATVDEFDKITQQLYDNGYVYIRLRDLVVETKNADGSSSFTANTQLMLPPGKKPIILSIDDCSYYHSYEAASFPDKLVVDEYGNVKNHYVKADGTEEIGDFDVAPRLDTFIAEHPDASYHGARGIFAMTGYNGVFGYRTDADYELKEHLMDDQRKWLESHPDFNRQTEIEEATKVAEALKAKGWEFASHTWGHLSVTQYSVDQLKADNEKWVNNVQNIVGPVDTIIFAHGNDIGDWMPYSDDNEKYQYYKSVGYNFFCNVDASVPHWIQINENNVRTGRIDLDGYQIYQNVIGSSSVMSNLFDASSVFDSRRPTPVVANGQG